MADQTAGSNCLGLTAAVSLQDDGYNLTNDATGTACNFTSAAHDLVNKNPLLGSLASNGGPTKTMLPATTSPAANVIPNHRLQRGGVPVCPGTDQRGSTRPGNGDTDCTIGAVEVALTNTTTTTVTLLPATSVAHGTRVTYVVAVTPKTGNGIPTGTVTFKTGPTSLCKAVLSGGVAACGATTAPVGTDTINGDLLRRRRLRDVVGYRDPHRDLVLARGRARDHGNPRLRDSRRVLRWTVEARSRRSFLKLVRYAVDLGVELAGAYRRDL